MPTYLLNEIPNIKEKSYLELGIFDGHHFRTVNTKMKTSVDLNHPADSHRPFTKYVVQS